MPVETKIPNILFGPISKKPPDKNDPKVIPAPQASAQPANNHPNAQHAATISLTIVENALTITGQVKLRTVIPQQNISCLKT